MNASIVTSIISAVLSSFAFCFSIYVFIDSKRAKRLDALFQYRSSVNTAYQAILEKEQDLNILASSELGTGAEAQYNAALSAYLSLLDDACAMYLMGKLDKERFKQTFNKEISDAIEMEKYRAVLGESRRYRKLRRYYDDVIS